MFVRAAWSAMSLKYESAGCLSRSPQAGGAALMPRGRRTSPEKTQAILEAAGCGVSHAAISRQTGVAQRTVGELLAKHSPMVERFKDLNEPGMRAVWRKFLEDGFEDYSAARDAGKLTARDRQSYAVSMAISSEKLLLVHGRPTATVENIHEIRVSLTDVAEKLLRVGGAVSAARPAL